MDVDQIFSIIGVVVNAPLVILIFRHYLKTRYKASLILAMHFILFMGIHISFIPVPYLGISEGDIAKPLLILDVLLSLALPLLTVSFFETTLNRASNKLLIIFLEYFAFLIGFSFAFEWKFTFNEFWFISLENNVIFLYAIPFAGVVFYVFVRLYQIYQFNKMVVKSKKVEKTWIKSTLLFATLTLCLLLRYLGFLLITVQGLDFFSELISIFGMVVMAIIYLYDPSAFFISNARIQSISIFEENTGVAYYWYGQKPENESWKVCGLHGASNLLRDLSGASSHPNLLRFVDRVIFLEYLKSENIPVAAVIFATDYNPAFAFTLKQCVALFIRKYQTMLREWKGNQDVFKKFTSDLMNIFDYAFPKELRQKT